MSAITCGLLDRMRGTHCRTWSRRDRGVSSARSLVEPITRDLPVPFCAVWVSAVMSGPPYPWHQCPGSSAVGDVETLTGRPPRPPAGRSAAVRGTRRSAAAPSFGIVPVSRCVAEEFLLPGSGRPAAWRLDPEHPVAQPVEHFPAVGPQLVLDPDGELTALLLPCPGGDVPALPVNEHR